MEHTHSYIENLFFFVFFPQFSIRWNIYFLYSCSLKNTSKKQVHWNWQWWYTTTCHAAVAAANINVIAMMMWIWGGVRWMRAHRKRYFNAIFMNAWKPVWLLLLLHIFAHIVWKFYNSKHLAIIWRWLKRVFIHSIVAMVFAVTFSMRRVNE